jgi:hypothetical protein
MPSWRRWPRRRPGLRERAGRRFQQSADAPRSRHRGTHQPRREGGRVLHPRAPRQRRRRVPRARVRAFRLHVRGHQQPELRADAARRATTCCCVAATRSSRAARWRSEHAALPMLARTHGQTASPTTLGKEIANVVARLRAAARARWPPSRSSARSTARSATTTPTRRLPGRRLAGELRALRRVARLAWNPYTTQIEPHDWIAEYCDALAASTSC